MVDWFACGEEYFEAGEYVKALECYEKANSDPYAFERMGWIYENGLGVEKDLIRAACLYGKAAGFYPGEYPGKAEMAGLGRILDQVEWKALAAADGGYTFWVLGCLYRTGWGVEKDAEKALKYYLCAAEAGNESAMNDLGKICEEAGDFEAALRWYERAENFSMLSEFWWAGRGGVQDYDRAFEYLRRDIEADRVGSAPVELGCMYECGLGVEKDPAAAIAHYREALDWDGYSMEMALWRLKALGVPAEQTTVESKEAESVQTAAAQDSAAPTAESISAEIEKMQEERLERELSAAELGDIEAMVRLGEMYLSRDGVANAVKAARWFRKAAELGNADGMARLGMLYEEGRGVLKNEQKAVQWYRKAAELGNNDGMFCLGSAYRYGRGLDGDLQESLKWYRAASELGHSQAVREMCRIDAALKGAEQGDAEAMDRLGCMYRESGKTADAREATDWFRKAAELGHTGAMVHLGEMYDSYRTRHGIHGNDQEALKWYRKAAELGDAEGMFRLGGMYHFGRGVDGGMQEALKWYRMAAERGSLGAMNSLGYMYRHGKAVAADAREALKWYRMAADLGDACSMVDIAMMYECGDGVEENMQTAHCWYEKAAAAEKDSAEAYENYLRESAEIRNREE